MRRVAFSTISQTVESNGNLNSSTKSDLLNKKKSSKKDNDEERALRFEINLNLSDTSNDNCPEFSYAELVKEAESNNADLPDDLDSIYERAEDDKLKEIAKNFERKYASKKKKYKKSYEDYIDKGLGYDETDSFIDNQEAYDELIPSTITTKYGGFYINFGKLEFRACSDEEDDAIVDEEDDEDSREFRASANSKKRKNRNSDLNQNKKRRKRIIESDDEEDDANQNDNSQDLDSDDEEMEDDDSESISSSSNSQQQSQFNNKKKKSQKNPNQIIDNIIDSVVKKVNKNGNATTQNSSIKLNSQANDLKDEDAFRIPDQLPANIKDKLTQLKNMKLNTPDNKKARNYSDDVYKLVFDADYQAQNCSSSVRSQVQSWFTNYLAISKDTLVKRLKKMRITMEEMKLKQNVSTLRMEVSYLIEECEEAYEAKLTKWEEDKKNGLNVNEPPEDLDKEFKFNDKVRDLLRKILNSKRLLVDLAGIKGKQEEDNITNYFNNEIKNIWPPNWISNSTLLKVAGFISKYGNQASLDKSSVSVIKKSPTRPTNSNTQQNVPKTSQLNNSHNNSNSNAKSKHHNQPKDLSTDKSLSNKHDKSFNHNSQPTQHQQQTKTESLISKKQKNEQHQKLLNNSNQLDTNFNQQQQQQKQQQQQQQQYSLNSMNKNHSNFVQQSNIEQIQQKISQQLKEHNSLAKNLKQLQQQQQFASQQSKNQQIKNASSLDKPQNLTNYGLANNLSPQNFSKKPQQSSSQFNDLQRQLHSSTPTTSHHNSTSLNNSNNVNSKFIDQKPFQMPSNNKISTSGTSSKQSINKSLEVDYKFDKAIKKSLIDEQIKQNLNLPSSNQFHRSSSLPNSNLVQQQQNTQSNPSHSKQQQQQLNYHQQQQSKSPMNPKPAHSNNSNNNNNNSSHSLPSNSNNNLYPNQLAHQQMMHQYAMHQYLSEALKIYQEKKTSNNLNSSTNSLNNFNFGKNFNTGNNQQTQINSNNSQSYVGSNSSNSLVSNQMNNQMNSQINNQMNNQMNSQISNQMNAPVNNSLAFKNQGSQKAVKNDFDINSIIGGNNDKQTANQFYSSSSSTPNNSVVSSNRYSSPNQLNSTNLNSNVAIATSLTPQSAYQKTDLASLNSDKNYDPNSIYSDYMGSLNSHAHQQQLYSRNIQQRQDDDFSKRK